MVDGDVGRDQFVLIHVEGMHCHKCERTIQQALAHNDGVYEVEVDFASGLASVLFDREKVNIGQLVDEVNSAGYRATGFTMGDADQASRSTHSSAHE